MKSNVMPNIVIVITLVCVFFMLSAVAYGQEPLRRVVVIAPATSQAQPLLSDCAPLGTALSCQLSTAQIDDLTGYADVVVLTRSTFLSTIQR